MNQKIKILLFFFLIYSLFCFLSLNQHSRAKLYTYHSELWADKAGYNVYLPSLFIYNFDGKQFPHNIEKSIGNGFKLDTVSSKVITKYPYGVSLLQTPFWLIAHWISSEKDGFSIYYQKSIDFAGSFYLTLGLFFLFFTIRNFQKLAHSILLCFSILFSSGIFYYGIIETGMSHIYSFCCLSIITYLTFKLNEKNSNKYLFLLFIISLIYLIIRPLNIIFIIPFFLFFLYNKTITISFSFFSLPNILKLSFTTALLILPQILYYKYAFGSYLTNSYQNEPFLFPGISRVLEMLFSPNNGLIFYYPVLLILSIYFLIERSTLSYLSLFLILIYILIYSSWWSLSLGCGFGHRAINDIIIFLFLPIILSRKIIPKFLLGLFILCILINIKFIFSYDTCLHQSDNWNYSEYKSILFGEFK